MTEPTAARDAAAVITAEGLRQHWQAHRQLTRRVIEAFPEPELFTFSVGGMRPFAELVTEMVGMAAPVVRGVATGEWAYARGDAPATRADLLRQWDEATAALDRLWGTIPPHRFQEHDVAFGQFPGPGIQTLLYAIDNEIHHRGQGYVYLRALGVEPPGFWDRG